jgi:hypothetical protein
MAGAEQERAPRWRSTAAALVDLAVTWPVRRQFTAARALRLRAPSGEVPPPQRAMTLPANLIAEALREQLGSPGQRLLGIRTVDRRTGARVELWRSLLIVASGWASRLVVSRFAPPGPTADQQRAVEAYWRELHEIGTRHADDPDAAAAERRALVDRRPPPLGGKLWRAVGPTFATGLLMIRLRRRLAPTIEVLTSRGPHRP